MRWGEEPWHARWSARLLLVWSLLLVIELAWSPFHFERTVDLEPLLPHTTAFDVVGNVFLFAPFAVSWVLAWSPVSSGPGGGGGRYGGIGGLVLSVAFLSLMVEVGQLFSPERVASALDLALNTGGAGLTAVATVQLREHTGRRWIVPAMAGAAFLVLAGSAMHAHRTFAPGMRLADWRAEFGIAAGDEIGADRAYVGFVTDAFVCGGVGDDRVCADPGEGRSGREKLVAAAEESQVVEFGARVVSGSDEQSGPTRIVTFSDGAFLRNVTLGQEGTSLVIRIRTPLTGTNARNYEMWIHDAVLEGVPTRVTTRFRDGAVQTVIDAAGEVRREAHVFDAFSAFLALRGPESVPASAEVGRRLFMLLLLLPVAALALDLFGRWRAGGGRPRE